MFGSIINRFQSFSPVASPVTSPKTSRRNKYKSGGPAHRRSLKDEYRDVQSEPEDAFTGGASATVGYRRGTLRLHPTRDDGGGGGGGPSSPSVKKNRGRKQQPALSQLTKSKSTTRLDVSAPTAAHPNADYRLASKSMGRLDGLKQVRNDFPAAIERGGNEENEISVPSHETAALRRRRDHPSLLALQRGGSS